MQSKTPIFASVSKTRHPPPVRAAMLQEEKAATQYFQPLPFYYVEISKLLFHDAVEAFVDSYMEVRRRVLFVAGWL